ncbi:MAG: NAD-dependent epimerase/dehydratase family protein [Clostridia bacterium]|nr:NAD-dependent epimerase/dehydratase family protein [Clostridia bacterium]
MNILITGEDSYIGTSFTRYAAGFPQHTVHSVSVRDDDLAGVDFSNIDSVFHVAGIAHVDYGNPSEELKQLYKKVNTELPVNTAKRAKAAGVRQFIFMSSSIVYNKPRNKTDCIGPDTEPTPNSEYGYSKLNAEKGLLALSDENFRVCIIRCPLVYGPGCKGNYPTLAKVARRLPFFPKIDNERSVLFSGHLARFVMLLIENHESGFFWPQNKEYVSTSDLVRKIAQAHGRHILIIPGFNWLFRIAARYNHSVRSAVNSCAYDQQMSQYKQDYRPLSLEETIAVTEDIK